MGALDAWIGLLLLSATIVAAGAFIFARTSPSPRRRCPRCWYQMPHGTRCSECGHDAPTERTLHRRRVRRRVVASVLAVLLAGQLLRTWPDIRARGVRAAVPNTVTFLLAKARDRNSLWATELQTRFFEFGWLDRLIVRHVMIGTIEQPVGLDVIDRSPETRQAVLRVRTHELPTWIHLTGDYAIKVVRSDGTAVAWHRFSQHVLVSPRPGAPMLGDPFAVDFSDVPDTTLEVILIQYLEHSYRDSDASEILARKSVTIDLVTP